MKGKLLVRACIGFLFGIALMFLIPPILNGTPIGGSIYSEELLQRVGSPEAATAVSLLVMGLFGAFCMGGTLFYEIESWPLALATAAHYLVMALGYLIPNRLLCWNMPVKQLLAMEGCMALGFCIIWLIMYLRYKREVRELNELNEKLDQETGAEQK
ncbi:MAG: DUF3021 domain-containing protein [Oscillospiraceae bacterium]|nr:DUF3021 domain-containing protein [Oscillospiraceae bacterium]